MTTATFSFATIAPAMPEIVLLALSAALLVVDLYLRGGEARHVTYGFTQAALAIAGLVTLGQVGDPSVVTLHGMYVADMLGAVLKVSVIVTVMATLAMSRTYLGLRGLLTGEFLALALFGTIGMMVMISAHHFLTLYLGLELMALAQYSMVALERDSARATEAAMKYFVLGALASGLLLYGMSMIYGATGSLEITRIADAIGHAESHAMLGVFGLVFVVAGIAFKLGAAPFHMWIPDVYHGAATPTTLYIGAAPKLAALGFILRLLADGLQGMTADWQQMLVVLAVCSLLVGNVVAIAQSNLKRMLAYSTISHMGFMALGIIAGDDTGYGAALFYGISYMLMTLGSFGLILVLSRAGFEAENIDDFRGLNQKSKWCAFIMLIMMFSLAGIPPTVGFFAKLVVLQAVLDAGYTWLVVYAVLLSVVGAFYYLRIVRLMYMEAPTAEITVDPHPGPRWVLSAAGLATLILGILPAPLLDLCVRAISASM
jgi:NADH-quinone oxidoreductase subunit N